MSKKYKEALLRYNESETLPAGLMALTGFKQKQIKIEKSFKGVSTYSFRKRLKLALNSITAFSSKPLVFIGLLGMSITSMAFLILLITIIRKLFFTDFQSGWISIIVSIWLVGGLILSSVGIIGIYLAKVFNQVKNRPLYIIKEIIG
jgi:putative glycosyltransferase